VISREPTFPEQRNEIDLKALWRAALRHKYLVAATAALCVAAAVILALTATPIFRAEVTVAPVKENGMGGGGSLTGELGGLASIAGLDLGDTGANKEYQAVLQSRHLIEEFVRRNDLVPQLLLGLKTPQNLWFAGEVFRKNVVVITEDKLKGITTVSIEWTDPVTAARWANGFVALANELIRTRAIENASRNVDYLNKQSSQTTELGVQRAMFNLIESQMKTLMLANGRSEYAFTIVDPAVPPQIRARPKRTLIVLTGGVIGLLLGAVVALAYERWNRRARTAALPLRV
jgi:uncharacterized protein involved in exopolysaccharide biosynthesis